MLTHKEYFTESTNYLKILKLTQGRVENKIKEIIPHPQRIKRGLVNAVGSVFKAITGNLDASDGERYEKLIKNLENNQNKLATNILNQNSISTSVIDKFSSTVQQIGQNQKQIENRINQVSMIVQKTAYKENMDFIRDILNQVINLYEIIDSILQDIENSITFSKLKLIHPSIIKIEDLVSELRKIEKSISPYQLPLPINLENVLLFENIIDIDCFILNNKITYLLRVPIVNLRDFEYYHLYSIPVKHQSLFKVVIPRNKFLIKNQFHYTYRETPCKKILVDSFLCDKEELKEIDTKSPCEVNLLHFTKSIPTCRQIGVTITQPVANQLDTSNQWIFVLPQGKLVELKCHHQEERQKLTGTYIVTVPIGCRANIGELSIKNTQKIVESSNKPMIFPDIEEIPPYIPVLNLSFHLQEIKLDELHKLKHKIEDNNPRLFLEVIPKVPSLWTIFIYVLIITGCVYLIYKYIKLKGCFQKKTENTEDGSPRIELPLTRCS